MSLKAIVDKIDDVPETARDFYVEKNGKYELAVELNGVEGVKTFTDFGKLSEALRKERNDHKSVRERMSLLGDRKIEDILSQLDRIPELEASASGKIDEEKMNELLEGRIRTKLAPVERERDTLKNQLLELSKTVEQYTVKERTRSIHDAVRSAATASKVLPEAMEDALMLAERVFEVNEEGKVVTKDNVGVTPGVDAVVWLTDLQSKRPHWWGPSGGSGAGGNRNGGNAGNNPWSFDNWNMTEQGRIYSENPSRAEQLAKAAGTFIGGGKPQPRK